MQQELLIAIIAGIGGMLGWGFADFFAKKTVDKIGDLSALFWQQLIGVFPLLILFLINPEVSISSNFDLFTLAIFGVISGSSYLILYRAFEKGQVSIISPIFASYGGLVVLLSAFIFGEQIPALRGLAMAVIFSGIILSSVDFKNIKSSLKGSNFIKGLPEVLVALTVFSLWLVYYGNFVNDKSWVFSILLVRVFSAITLYITSKVRGVSLKVPSQELWTWLFLIATFDVAAFSLVTFGFSETNFVSIVAMLSGAFSLPTIILARIFLREKATAIQTIGSIVIILGIVFLSSI